MKSNEGQAVNFEVIFSLFLDLDICLTCIFGVNI